MMLLRNDAMFAKETFAKRHHSRSEHHWHSQHHLPQANIIEKSTLARAFFCDVCPI
jgi:hypothetical protein